MNSPTQLSHRAMAIFGPEIAIDERSVRTVFYEGRCPPAEKFRKGEVYNTARAFRGAWLQPGHQNIETFAQFFELEQKTHTQGCP